MSPGTDATEYWARVRGRWDEAVHAISSGEHAQARVRSSPLRRLSTRLLGPQLTIALNGQRGGGKTELFRDLTGTLPNRPRGVSHKPETLRGRFEFNGDASRTTFLTIPGQWMRPYGTARRDVYSGNRVPRAVIHIVSAGYDEIWDGGRAVVEDRIVNERDQRLARIAVLEAELGSVDAPTTATDVARREELDELRRQQARPLMWHLREHNRVEEHEHFARFRESLGSLWTGEDALGKPIWLIIAVAKCDLWWSERDEVRSYYLPDGGDRHGGSRFTRELRALVDRLGHARAERLAVVPVATRLEPYQTTHCGVTWPDLDETWAKNSVNHLRNLVGVFNAPRR